MPTRNLPGAAWLAWLKNTTLRVGVLTGVYLATVMVIAVIAANRISFLDEVADLRNWVFRLLFGLVALIPAVIFRKAAGQLFVAGLCGWSLFTLAYLLMGIPFEMLHARLLRPLNVFMLGTLSYGVVALLVWFAGMVSEARAHPVGASRRRPY